MVPRKKPDPTFTTFAIHQIVPVTGWQSVSWDAQTATHFCTPVPLLAVVARIVRRCHTGELISEWLPNLSEAEQCEVLGMEYADGAFVVCDEACNFCGLLAPEMTLADFERDICNPRLHTRTVGRDATSLSTQEVVCQDDH